MDDSSSLNRPLARSSGIETRGQSLGRSSTCPEPRVHRRRLFKKKKSFEPSSVWAPPKRGTKAAKKAEAAKAEDAISLPPLSQHWSRFFLVECMGNFVSTTLYSACLLTIFLNLTQVAWLNLPVVAMNAPFQQTFSFPTPTLYLAILVGLSYSLGLLTAPESKLNPVFTIVMAMFGLSEWRTVFPSVLGQLTGVMFSNLVVYNMAKDLAFWNPDDLQTASIFGVTYPASVPSGFKPFPIALDPTQPAKPIFVNGTTYKPAFPLDGNMTMYFEMNQVSTLSAFFSTAVFTALLVLVIIPLFTAQKLSHAANAFGFGLIIACFVAAGSALGVSSNPALWLGGAITCLCIGFPAVGDNGIFTSNDYYSWVSVVAPFVGAITGGLILELYGFALFFPPEKWSLSLVKCKKDTSASETNAPQESLSKNPHVRFAADDISSASGNDDSGDDVF